MKLLAACLGKVQWGSEVLAFPPANQSVAASDRVAEWASRITSVWANGAARTLELAKVLSAARRRLPHGEWASLRRLQGIPFTKRMGDMLATTGKNLEAL